MKTIIQLNMMEIQPIQMRCSLVKSLMTNMDDKNKAVKMIQDIPYIKQQPILRSGCEATSHAMALNYGIQCKASIVGGRHYFYS